MKVVAANDLRSKCVSGIERILQEAEEVVISVRGKPRYVVMDITRHDYLRECELAAAWAQTREDVAVGRYRREGADAHIARTKERTS